MRNRRVVILISLGWFLAVVAAPGQARRVGFLTSEPSSRDPMDIAMDFLRKEGARRGLVERDLAGVTLLSRSVTKQNQTTHIYLRQSLGGIEVVNANANISVSREGRVITEDGSFVADLARKINTRSPKISADEAIVRAARQLGLSVSGELTPLEASGGVTKAAVFSGDGISLDPIPVHLAYYAVDSGEVRLSWDMVVRTTDQKHWWNLWVDASSGDILDKSDWIAHDAYDVLAIPLESPDDGKRTIVTNAANPLASPFGWHDTNGAAGAEFTLTRGNNVWAQEDADANNTGGFSPDGGPGLVFQFPIDFTRDPSTYQSASITNLFYWNNILHDIHYQYGFDESSGNFQLNNYGRANSGGGDPVLADAQDGSGTNNANFATPPDGFAGRMQMFLWTPPNDTILIVNAPRRIAGDYAAGSAEFGPRLTATGITDDVVLVNDSTGTSSDGCEALTNASAVSGNIAIVDRGTCTFVTKVRNAQKRARSR